MSQLSTGNKKTDRVGYCRTRRQIEPMPPLLGMHMPQETALTVLIMAFSILQSALPLDAGGGFDFGRGPSGWTAENRRKIFEKIFPPTPVALRLRAKTAWP